MVGTDIKSGLKKAVDAALLEKNPDEADSKYMTVLQYVRAKVGDNENDIANALQAIAKDLEESGRKMDAFEFKQKTCILLLELTMNPLPPIPEELLASAREIVEAKVVAAPIDTILELVMSLHIVKKLNEADKYYREALHMVPENPNGGSTLSDALLNRAPSLQMSTTSGTTVIVVEGQDAEFLPVFQSSNKTEALSRLAATGWMKDDESFETERGKLQLYSHDRLGRLALIQ